MLFLRKWLVVFVVLLGAVIWCCYSIASDYESIRVTDVVQYLSPSKVAVGYKYAYITMEGVEIRYRKDGKALATEHDGHLVIHCGTIQLRDRKEIMHFSFIKTMNNTGDTFIRVSYEDNSPYSN